MLNDEPQKGYHLQLTSRIRTYDASVNPEKPSARRNSQFLNRRACPKPCRSPFFRLKGAAGSDLHFRDRAAARTGGWPTLMHWKSGRIMLYSKLIFAASGQRSSMAEHGFRKAGVEGSSPSAGSIIRLRRTCPFHRRELRLQQPLPELLAPDFP